MQDLNDEKQKRQLDDLLHAEEEQLIELLAKSKYNLGYVDLERLGIDNEALRAISEEDARKLRIGPFKLSGNNIFIAIRSPSDQLLSKLRDDMKRKNLNPIFYMVSMASLNKIWDRYTELSMAKTSRMGGIDVSAEVLRELAKQINKIQDIKKLLEETISSQQAHKVSRLLEIILAGAIAIKASDIHIEPEKDICRLRIRLDGVLQDVLFLETDIYNSLNSRIKLLSGMKLTLKTAQDGRFSIVEDKEEINIRTSLVPGFYGESIVMRILDPKSILVKLDSLGIEKYLFSIIQSEIEKPNGLILVTGPTGSGKTTTLYSFLQTIYSPEIKIITIEDPVEYRINGITQTQTNLEKGYTFLEGLRSALRQDPDVVMVGEIRDSETAKTAVQASLTGHMVFSTLHTNNAAGAIPRLIDLEVNPKILVSAFSISIAQRLVRKLCDFCKKELNINEKDEAENKKAKTIINVINSIKNEGKDLTKYDIDPNIVNNISFKIFSPTGCEKCGFIGYKGRIGIFEAIKIDTALQEIIPKNPSEYEIKKIAQKQGILSMRQDGVIKILKGITSFDEVKDVVDLMEE